jgi:hypothetical protein
MTVERAATDQASEHSFQEQASAEGEYNRREKARCRFAADLQRAIMQTIDSCSRPV